MNENENKKNESTEDILMKIFNDAANEIEHEADKSKLIPMSNLLHAQYEAFIDVGFSEDQSMKLIGVVLNAILTSMLSK